MFTLDWNRFITPGLLIGGCVTTFSCYCYYKYKKMKNSVLKLAELEEQVENIVIYFGAEGLKDCTNHIYKKKMCFKLDCPYRKLRTVRLVFHDADPK